MELDQLRQHPNCFYHTDNGVLLCGDCLEIMPMLPKVDLVLTDPPYGIDYGRSGGFSASHGWGPWRENVLWDKERPSKEIFKLILSQSKVQIIWGGNYFTDYLPPTMQWLIWDKCQRNFSLSDFEMAWSSQYKASRIFNYSRAKARLDGKKHPTQKPIALMDWCLSFMPQGTVLDPFLGSGTTAVACERLNRQWIGVEISEEYCAIAKKRIEKERQQLKLF